MYRDILKVNVIFENSVNLQCTRFSDFQNSYYLCGLFVIFNFFIDYATVFRPKI
jgi:hypothetical protein